MLDISDRKHAAVEREAAFEREHAARTQAEEATRLKDEFLANLSHELRTPMNAIIGWTHLLRSGRLEDSQRQRALESIDRGARSQAKLIEDLLDVSRIVSGKLSLTLQPVDLPRCVDAALESQRPAAQAKGITLEMQRRRARAHGDGRCRPPAAGVPEHPLERREVHARAAVASTSRSTRTADDAQRVASTDTGEGIAPEFLPYVFDRFRQADGTSTRTHMGLGLGLAIVRHVVELHGGTRARRRARARARARRSRSRFRWPTDVDGDAAQARSRTACPAATASRAGSAYACWSWKTTRRRATSSRPFSIAAASPTAWPARASEALSVLDDWQPDVIVSDIGMPDMDGYEFVRQLRARPPQQGGADPGAGAERVRARRRPGAGAAQRLPGARRQARGPGGPGRARSPS